MQSDLVLMSRTEKDLKAAKSDIESSCLGVSVHVVPADLQDLSTLHDVFSRCAAVAEDSTKKYQQFVVIHNAGSICDITKPMVQQTEPSLLQQQLALNFTSMSILTSLFLSHFTSGERLVVNITSLLAKVHLAGFCMYSATRAARNAFIGTLAAENPDVRFLTYNPGEPWNFPCSYNRQSYIEYLYRHSRLWHDGGTTWMKGTFILNIPYRF